MARQTEARPSSSVRGFTLIEVLIAVVMATMIIAALGGLVGQSLHAGDVVRQRNDVAEEAAFAMERIVRSVGHSQRLLLPLAENPVTSWSESVREVLAVALDRTVDRDGDGFADADNDKDGAIDEDMPDDTNNDGQAGIAGVDDNGNGVIDDGATADDDEDGVADEDGATGTDDDGDGTADEDPGSDANGDGSPGVAGTDDDGDGLTDEGHPFDDDEDGLNDEDWLDPVVYSVSGSTLLERTPNPDAIDGNDYTESTVAENVTLFRVERIPQGGDRALRVDLTLELTPPGSEPYTLHTQVRVGGAL
jgi:prepilin-type N-terminal cleavage/methylation domain-containing protein